MKPTSEPTTRGASSVSKMTNVPPSGSMTSLRVSRMNDPENFDNRTCGNRRSMSGFSCSVNFSSNNRVCS